MSLENFLNQYKRIVDSELDFLLPKESLYPREIHSAMRYAVLNGGKRIRPLLAIASNLACGGRLKDVLKVACAIELVHSYSLVHDDLPAMDNSPLRRGKPAVHKKFGEASAILCGDALLIFAFQILARGDDYKKEAAIINELSWSIGTYGMIGGQIVDIMMKGKSLDLPTVEYINIHKTGALIASSLKVGAISAGASKKEFKAMSEFGEYLGFTFQIIDDILDRDGITELIGLKESFIKAKELINKAKNKLGLFGDKAKILEEMADYILERKN